MSVLRLAPLAGLVTILVAGPASAQIESPVKWTFTARKVNAATYEVHMTATVDGGWRLYAQQAGEGPTPTRFTLKTSPQVALKGSVMEVGRPIVAQDTAFNTRLKYYQNQVDFVQKVTVKGKAPAALKGSVEFMVADDHQALPPKALDFKVALK
ncbi:hypothetical protein [Asticcacaulis solisilvae]|uniref:hypothetical protein n=1 Tax=Asticcacaulis solisilvae TaxID=1217274 RepID=UPI003FD8B19C